MHEQQKERKRWAKGARPKQTPPEMPTAAELASGGWTQDDASGLAWVYSLTRTAAEELAEQMPDMEPDEKRAMLKGWHWTWVGG